MEGLVAGLGGTTVVNTGHTESVVQNLQLRDNKREREGEEEKTKNGKKKENSSENEPRRKGWREKTKQTEESQIQLMTMFHSSCEQVPSSPLSENPISELKAAQIKLFPFCMKILKELFEEPECFIEFGLQGTSRAN